MTAFGIICAAIIVEGLITYVKTFVSEGKVQWQIIVALVLGILVAVGYGLDIFALFGMVSVIPYLGTVLTGILISRGSNYVYDLIDLISGLIDKLKKDDA